MERPFESELIKRLSDDKPYLQVLLGPRQVGKTTGLLRLFNDWQGPKTFCSTDDSLDASRHWLVENWQAAEDQGSGSLLVIDEIQKVTDWSHVIKGLWDKSLRNKRSLKVVLLGSSSLSIQTGLSESLAGRFELTFVPHWSFAESAEEFGYSLDDWLTWGGYPGADAFRKDDARWRSYLTHSIVDAVIGRDILTQRTVKNPALFRQAFVIACSYPAQEISYAKLLGQLQDSGNTDLVKSYLELYEAAFLVFCVQKYAKTVRSTKSSSPKLLIGCPALANLALGKDFVCSPEGRGRVFESAVGMDLLQMGAANVYWWRDGSHEVDFVVRIDNLIFAIEVKSGRRKSAKGLDAFLKIEPNAIPCFVTRENYPAFAANPAEFLRSRR